MKIGDLNPLVAGINYLITKILKNIEFRII